MKRVLRCHDFGSGREATRSEYREYSQGVRQSHGPKLVPARRVAATIAAYFVGRLAHAPRPRSRAAWCGTGREAACSTDADPGLLRLLPQTGLRLTSRRRRDMCCAALRVIHDSGSQRTRASLCYALLMLIRMRPCMLYAALV